MTSRCKPLLWRGFATGRDCPLAPLRKRRPVRRATLKALKAKVVRPESSADLFNAAASSIIARRSGRVFDATAPRYANLIRLEPEVAASLPEPAGAQAGFHLIDTTMMYAPKARGGKRAPHAQRAWPSPGRAHL